MAPRAKAAQEPDVLKAPLPLKEVAVAEVALLDPDPDPDTVEDPVDLDPEGEVADTVVPKGVVVAVAPEGTITVLEFEATEEEDATEEEVVVAVSPMLNCPEEA
jgi:hypothetical protein